MIYFMIMIMTFCAALFQRAQDSLDEPRKDQDRLQGAWKMIYSEVGGKGFKPTNDIQATFEKDTKTGWMAGEIVTKCSFKIDPAKNPRTMDITIIENRLIPESKGTIIPCIYDFDKGCLRICYPADTIFFQKKHPTEFSTKEGDGGQSLTIYEKVKEKEKK